MVGFFDALALGIHDEDDSIHLIQQLLPGGCVLGRSRHRDDLDPSSHAANLAELDGEGVVADRRVEPRGDRLEFAPVVGPELRVNHLDVGRLAGALDPPVDDAGSDLGALPADLGHQIFPFFCSSRRA